MRLLMKLLSFLAFLAACTRAPEDWVVGGDVVDIVGSQEHGGLVLIVEPDHCVGCLLSDAFLAIRTAQAKPELENIAFVRAILISSVAQDSTYLVQSLERERIEGSVTVISRKRLGTALSSKVLPVVFLHSGKEVIRVWPMDGSSIRVGRNEILDALMESLQPFPPNQAR